VSLSTPGFAQTLLLPERSTNALGGSEFAKRVESLELSQREGQIFEQITSGNVPNFLRKLCAVTVTNKADGKTAATFHVAPDYLAVGSDEDYFLAPISPHTAQRIADVLGCTLPTRKIVNDIYAAAAVKLQPAPILPSPAMTSMPVFAQHNVIVRTQRLARVKEHPLGALVAGHKKDVVISARLAAAPGKVAIYGWHQTNGIPIQPLYTGHTAAWVDYSHGIRLVQQSAIVDGATRTVGEVLADPTLAPLFSDEGPIAASRYPTNEVSLLAGKTDSSPPAGPTNTGARGFTGFQSSTHFDERIASFTIAPGIKIHINAPPERDFTAGRKILLIFYALPNGNTTEQTIGRAVKPGDDWRFDIQHIGAQTRFLRELIRDRVIVIAYLESAPKSWPAWRKQYGDQLIPGAIAAVKKLFSGQELEIVLSSHSGGGSFIFGYLNTLPEIPSDIVRIAFLDSNYAYDRVLGHTGKLARWSSASEQHRLCVLAYNDAVALLNGTNFVSAAGGTWGKSHEMQRDLAKSFKFTSVTNSGFEKYDALGGRVMFMLKENPERKIFHTIQVERNGFIHSIVSGTTLEGKGYEYFGPRAYSQWIQPE
jgi:hypothetical protein